MKKITEFIVCVCFLALLGCGSEKAQATETMENMVLRLEKAEGISVGQEITENGLAINLEHVAFEENFIILDYTLKGKDSAAYEGIKPQVYKEGLELGSSDIQVVEEQADKVRQVCYMKIQDGFLSQDNIGESVSVQFSSIYGNRDVGGSHLNFSVEIKKVFQPKKIEVHQEFVFGTGAAVVDHIEISKFRTEVYMDTANMAEFQKNFYNWEIKGDNDEALQFLGGTDGEYLYTGLPEGCKEAGLTLIQYKEDLSYEAVSETVKLSIGN